MIPRRLRLDHALGVTPALVRVSLALARRALREPAPQVVSEASQHAALEMDALAGIASSIVKASL